MPVVPQLSDPAEVLNVVAVLVQEGLNYVLAVHVDGDQGA